MSHKRWVVLLGLVGVLFCVSYLYFANKYCSVEQSTLNLNWRLIPDLDKNEKHNGAAYRYGRRKDPEHPISANLPLPYTLVQKDEPKKDADHRQGERQVWLTKFACDAKLSDLLIAIFTYGLFLATGWLVWATLKLWKAGDDQFTLLSATSAAQSAQMQESIEATRIAADAASRSAYVAEQTLLASERPYVLIEVVDTKNLTFALQTTPSMVIKFVNHGNSPAFIKTLFIELLDDPTMENPTVVVSELPRIYRTLASREETPSITVPVKTDNPSQVWGGERGKRLVLHGYVKYSDILDAMHSHHIFLRGGKNAENWTEEGGVNYNYRQTQLPYEVKIRVE